VLRHINRLAVGGLAVLFINAGTASPTLAQGTVDRGASILLFAKVVAGESTDTLIELANLSDNRVNAYCAYLNSAAEWQSLDFRIALGPGQPLYWTAARGRTETVGEEPIDIPAVPAGFRGELLCVQVDAGGAPFSGDHLAGRATLADLASGNVATYRTVGLRGGEFFNDNDPFLCIGGEPSDNCLIGAEYEACPAEWIVSLPAEGAVDGQLGPGSALSSRFAVAPCSQNLRETTPASVDIQLSVFNELAQQFTGRVAVTCWADLSLADLGGQIFTRGTLGSDYAEARLAPASGAGGFFLVAETTRTSAGESPTASTVAFTPHHRGAAETPDVIVLP
jgi:hypothetical protein